MGAWDAPPGHRLRKGVQQLAARAGFHIGRTPPNRFDAMAAVIAHLAARGYSPRAVIDGGANVGRWTDMASRAFPSASFYLVEPQPGCRAALERLRRHLSLVNVLPYALAAPGIEQVTMAGSGADSTSEGAWVADSTVGSPDQQIVVVARTLDQLFTGRFTPADRLFLKLDLEGQELNALKGAGRLLEDVEVILSEVRFFDIDHSGRPVFADVAESLRARGFEVYDFGSLMPRTRDGRLYRGDVVFVRRDSALRDDVRWK
jgi:FkbM family methyltransferase